MIKIAIIEVLLTVSCFVIGFLCGKLTSGSLTERIRIREDEDELPIAHVGYSDAECGREK